MHRTKRILIAGAAVALLFTATSHLVSEDAPTQTEEQKLLGVLRSEAPTFEVAKACQRLAVIGTKESVPVLAGLLSSPDLAHYARFGLEPIPDPSVDEAFREAIGSLRGKLLVGVLNSIGRRRDEKATSALKKLLRDPDFEVAAAAAAALGKIGTPAAADTLEELIATSPQKTRAAAADAAFFCAEALLAGGDRDQATALYDAVRNADLPEHLRLAATRGAILARGSDGVPLLVDTLREDEHAFFLLALRVAREMKGADVTRALVAESGKLSAERRALALRAIGDRRDPTARPAVLEAAKEGTPEIRIGALAALESLGNASDVPVLARAAASSDPAVADAALSTLEALPGTGVDEAIADSIKSGDAALRVPLIQAAGRRRVGSAVPALKAAAGDDDAMVRAAAIQALGLTVGLQDLPILIERLTQPKAPEEARWALDALKAAGQRMPDHDACAEKLKESMAEAPGASKLLLLEVFSSLGGTKALEAVASHARDEDEALREAATRTLGDWGSEEAAPLLLEIVKSSRAETDRARALRAFSSVVRRIGFGKEQRLALCGEAMKIAQNDAERRIVLETYAGIPAPETLALIRPYLADSGLKEDACRAVMEISERLIRARPNAVIEPLRQVIRTTEKKEVAARAEVLLKQVGAKP